MPVCQCGPHDFGCSKRRASRPSPSPLYCFTPPYVGRSREHPTSARKLTGRGTTQRLLGAYHPAGGILRPKTQYPKPNTHSVPAYSPFPSHPSFHRTGSYSSLVPLLPLRSRLFPCPSSLLPSRGHGPRGAVETTPPSLSAQLLTEYLQQTRVSHCLTACI